MKPLIVHRGVAVPILQPNVDTDAIIPSREMKRVSKHGLGEGLFAHWRYMEPGSREPNPDFVLNQPAYCGATIILGGSNFGCGSSREHAVWALVDYGIRIVIAPSFGAIFYNNCIRNGILPLRLPQTDVGLIAKVTEPDPQSTLVEINLPEQSVVAGDIGPLTFEIDVAHKEMLLQGLDAIALTLREGEAIAEFECVDRQRRPWI